MNLLEISKTRADLLNIAIRIKIALDEIEEKRPDKLEYINPMKESIENLHNAYEVFKQMEVELKASRQRNFDLEVVCMKLKAEKDELQNNLDLTNKMKEL